MYFKVLPGNATYDALIEINKKMIKCKKIANNLAKKLGSKNVAGDPYVLAGGIGGLEFDSKPEGWKMVGEKWQHLYYPKASKANKNMLINISNLPVVEYEELNNIIKFEGNQAVSVSGGIAFVKTFSVSYRKNVILVKISDGCEYDPIEDLTEIKVSEYNKLLEIKNAKGVKK